jgi:hypothetical protein
VPAPPPLHVGSGERTNGTTSPLPVCATPTSPPWLGSPRRQTNERRGRNRRGEDAKFAKLGKQLQNLRNAPSLHDARRRPRRRPLSYLSIYLSIYLSCYRPLDLVSPSAEFERARRGSSSFEQLEHAAPP